MSDFWRIVPIALRAIQHRDKILELINLLMPAIKEMARVAPVAWPLGRELAAELFPEMQHMIADKALAKFDVRWLQRGLNQVMKTKLAEDGIYGEATRAAVTAFQRKYMTPNDIDGWAGLATCSALYNEMQKKESKP